MVTSTAIATQMINGLAYGSILVLVAIGLAIIFGLMGIVNFAHGAFYALGGYVGFQTVAWLGGGYFLATLIVVPIVVALIGIAAEQTVIKPLYGRSILYSLVLTFGLLLIFEEAIDYVWGQNPGYSTPGMFQFTVDLGVVNYPAYQLFVILIAAIVGFATWIFLQRTNTGAIIRAATENRNMVRSLGIDIDRIYLIMFAIGAGIAGLAGNMHAPMVNMYPEMGALIIIESFVVVVIGGLNSFRGSIVAGILVGEVRSLTYLVEPQAVDVIIFVFMAVMLLVRPQGLAGSIGGVE